MKKKPRIRPTEAKALGTPIYDEPFTQSAAKLGTVKDGTKPKLKTPTQVMNALRLKGFRVTLTQAAMLIGMTVDEAVEAASSF